MSACEFIGGAETLVRGSNNMLVAEGSPEAVAKMLSELLMTPEITDAELLDVFSNIRDNRRLQAISTPPWCCCGSRRSSVSLWKKNRQMSGGRSIRIPDPEFS